MTVRNALRICMEEVASNGYMIFFYFSSILCQALYEGNLDVAAVSELTAKGNDTYVV
jgi:hypothetical protein